MIRSPLAIDIETVGLDWDILDPEVQNYLLNRAHTEEERKAVPDQLALNPGTGRIVTIGMWRPNQNKGGVLIEDETTEETLEWKEFEENSMIYRGTEKEILKEFWRYASRGVGRLITFNGRAFDGPFLMLRSAILGVKPTRNFFPYRYSFKEHCDLAEVVSFHHARNLESLDFWCRQIGVESPKKDLEGSEVGQAYRAGKIEKIARYCLGDARATARLYKVLQPIIDLMDGVERV